MGPFVGILAYKIYNYIHVCFQFGKVYVVSIVKIKVKKKLTDEQKNLI